MVEWRDWMEDLMHLRGPAPVFARPPGLASLGSESYFAEPYRIGAPHRVYIGRDVGIGERSFLSTVEEYMGVRHDPVLRIGDGCKIGSDLMVACVGEVNIGPRVGMSLRVFIGDAGRNYMDDPYLPTADMPMADPVSVNIHEGAMLGLGSMVMPGVTIGERAVVSAGSVVTRDVPPRSVVFGNPARVIRSWNEETQQWQIGG